jgi:hypothetical protein
MTTITAATPKTVNITTQKIDAGRVPGAHRRDQLAHAER